MTETEMALIGRLVARAVKAEQGTDAGDRELAAVADEVSALVEAKPAYPRG
jgi:glycine hydroxymethyltransferase